MNYRYYDTSNIIKHDLLTYYSHSNLLNNNIKFHTNGIRTTIFVLIVLSLLHLKYLMLIVLLI